MHIGIVCLLGASLILVLGGVVSVVVPDRKINFYCSFLQAIAGLLIIVGSLACWGQNLKWLAPFPIYLGVAPLAFRVDSLSAVFSLLLGVIAFSTALFSPGYLRHLEKRINKSYYWSAVSVFIASMLLVFLAANALSFLVFWELMALSSAALVVADFSSRKAQKSALIYLGATRFATAFLTGGFLWLYSIFHSWNFSDWHLNSSVALVPSLLVAVGLCIKSGIWPFHIWLPYAHPMAPSPVSALMSGVMIKVALYAIIRLFLLDDTASIVLAALFLFLGAVSALWGVLFALVQQDIKKLLAYSSVENAGLILMAIGLCLFGQFKHRPLIAAIGLASALFHCLGHGLFKSLLFLGAGAIDNAINTRNLDQMGGLLAKLPYTACCFLIASLAICALPPLNGFTGKWLIYQGLFKIICIPDNIAVSGCALVCVGVLSLVGALALACFTKAFSIAFLGRPRLHNVENAVEVDPWMRRAQELLAILCLGMGLMSGPILELLSSLLPAYDSISIPAPQLGATGLFILVFFLLVYGFGLKRNNHKVVPYQTWECGYGQLSNRMQATSPGLVHSLALIFRPVLQYASHTEVAGKDRRHFPERILAETQMVSLLESRLYNPVITYVRLVSRHFSRLQAGSIHLYLLYVFVTLLVLLVFGTRA